MIALCDLTSLNKPHKERNTSLFNLIRWNAVSCESTVRPLSLYDTLFVFVFFIIEMRSDSYRVQRQGTTEAPSSWWKISLGWKAGVWSSYCPMYTTSCCSIDNASSGWTVRVRLWLLNIFHFPWSHRLEIMMMKTVDLIRSLSLHTALVDITATVLLLNPDFTTAWNVR